MFAVWLGYLYQKKVLDREKRREAYLEGYSTLLRMTDVIRHAEEAAFLAWSADRWLERPPGDPEGELVVFETLYGRWVAIASLLGIAVDFGAPFGSNPRFARESLRKLPGQIAGRLVFEIEDLRQT